MFLKALALGLTVPVAARLARTASAATVAPPKRFFLMYMPHGIAPEHYNPQVVGGDNTNFVLDDTNVSILGPLEQYKSYVNVYQGFSYPGGGTHSGIVSCLSGVDHAPTAGATAIPEITTPRTTLEHVIAHALGVTPLILGACSHQAYGIDNNGMLFWDTTPVDPQKNPAAAADKLFANLGASTTPTVDPNIQLRQDLLALTASEIQDLSSTLGGLTKEQTKLQTHLASIQSLQSGSGGSAPILGCSTRPTLPTVEMVRAASAGQVIDSSGGNDYFYQEANFQLLFQAQLELVAQALICNAAQVVALMPMYATCDFNFSFSAASGVSAPAGWAHHAGLSHTGYQPASGAQYNSPISVSNFDPTARVAFAGAQRWFAQQLVDKVVSLLATTDDPSAPGTKVLDNTVIYWMSEIGDGAGHTTQSAIEYPQVPSFLPLVTIGKAGGALKSGQVVPFTADRPASDLYLSLCKAMGAPNATFPDAVAPVTEVLT